MQNEFPTITIQCADPSHSLAKVLEVMGPNISAGREYDPWPSRRYAQGEVIEWAWAVFPRGTPSSNVKTHFAGLGEKTGLPFIGHHHPLLELIAQGVLRNGWYASIPGDQDCHEGSHGILSAPVYGCIQPPGFTKPLQTLGVGPINAAWPGYYAFLAFRRKQKA